MNENSLIQNKILDLLNKPPKSIGVIDNNNINYKDIYNLWCYYRLHSKEYQDLYGEIDVDWSDEKESYYSNLFTEYNIFNEIFKKHLESEENTLLLFYNLNENFFYCKFKSFNKISQDILEKYKDNIDKLNIQEDISMFWTIELKVPDLQEEFNEIYKAANIDINNILLVTF